MIWMLMIVAACAGVGIWFLRRGIRGVRLDDHPVCRNCAFDLFGLPPDAFICSECGGDLKKRGAVVAGNRGRRWGSIILGLSLLITSPLLLAPGTRRFFEGFDANHLKPTAWLLLETSTAGSDNAMTELVRRLNADSLSESQRVQLIGRLLSWQGSNRHSWNADWGDAFQAAEGRGEVTPDRWQKYLNQGMTFRLIPRAEVRKGAPLPVSLRVTAGRLGHGYSYRATSLNISGIIHPLKAGLAWSEMSDAMGTKGGGDGDPVVPANVIASLSPGPQTLGATIRLRPLGPDGTTMSIGTGVVYTQAAWTLLPPDSNTVELVCPEDEVNAMRQSVAITELTVARRGGSIAVSIDNPPEPFAFDVLVRAGTREWRITRVSGPAGIRMNTSTNGTPSDWDVGPEVDKVDVILRPSVPLAEEQSELAKIWGREIVFPKLDRGKPAKW